VFYLIWCFDVRREPFLTTSSKLLTSKVTKNYYLASYIKIMPFKQTLGGVTTRKCH